MKNHENNPPGPDALERRVIALLLGELNAEEAAAIRREMEQKPELAAFSRQMEKTIALVRKSARAKAAAPAESDVPAALSEERRKALLQRFREKKPSANQASTPSAPSMPLVLLFLRQLRWALPVSLAACVVCFLGLWVLSSWMKTQAESARSLAMWQAPPRSETELSRGSTARPTRYTRSVNRPTSGQAGERRGQGLVRWDEDSSAPVDRADAPSRFYDVSQELSVSQKRLGKAAVEVPSAESDYSVAPDDFGVASHEPAPSSRPSPPAGEKVPGGRLRGIHPRFMAGEQVQMEQAASQAGIPKEEPLSANDFMKFKMDLTQGSKEHGDILLAGTAPHKDAPVVAGDSSVWRFNEGMQANPASKESGPDVERMARGQFAIPERMPSLGISAVGADELHLGSAIKTITPQTNYSLQLSGNLGKAATQDGLFGTESQVLVETFGRPAVSENFYQNGVVGGGSPSVDTRTKALLAMQSVNGNLGIIGGQSPAEEKVLEALVPLPITLPKPAFQGTPRDIKTPSKPGSGRSDGAALSLGETVDSYSPTPSRGRRTEGVYYSAGRPPTGEPIVDEVPAAPITPPPANSRTGFAASTSSPAAPEGPPERLSERRAGGVAGGQAIKSDVAEGEAPLDESRITLKGVAGKTAGGFVVMDAEARPDLDLDARMAVEEAGTRDAARKSLMAMERNSLDLLSELDPLPRDTVRLNRVLVENGEEGKPASGIVENGGVRSHEDLAKAFRAPAPAAGAEALGSLAHLKVAERELKPEAKLELPEEPLTRGFKQGALELSRETDGRTERLEQRQRARSETKAEKAPEPTEEPPPPALADPRPLSQPLPETLTSLQPFSTFSLNVSDVSFKLAAASLAANTLPEPGSIRSEEFINAFEYHDPAPVPGAKLAFAWEQARHPFEHNRDLIRFSIQTAALGREPGRPLNLVLLLDNSGSMERADRVRIVREGLAVLARQLTRADRISVVAFARTARLWVDGLPGGDPEELVEQVGQLNPQGGTNLELALDLAYATARKHYLTNGNNRIILMTDGAANLGNVDPAALKEKVESCRRMGVALDCFGVGWEGYNDDLLEVLSRNGDGRYGFINNPWEAATEFADQLAGALRVAAANVKAQVQFNPDRVISYRQIGYEKHQLTKEQFRDNTVDAAEIGAAESGTALYSLQINPQGSGPLGVARVRFQSPATGLYEEREWLLPYQPAVLPLDQAYPSMRLAGVAAAFAEWLAQSPYAGNVTLAALEQFLNGVPESHPLDPRPGQLLAMIQQARRITGQ